MAVEIEVLDVQPQSMRIALYYPVPVARQIAAAADATRTPAGTRLSAQEITDLKNGALHELVVVVSINGLTKAQARPYVERQWADRQSQALADYEDRYQNVSFVGKAFDGTAWS